jgi:hypothetical protein
MALSDQAKHNFATLLHAAAHGRLALMECTRVSDNKVVPMVCAVSDGDDGGEAKDMIPLAEFTAGFANPYELYVPPHERSAYKLAKDGLMVPPEGVQPLPDDEDAGAETLS